MIIASIQLWYTLDKILYYNSIIIYKKTLLYK